MTNGFVIGLIGGFLLSMMSQGREQQFLATASDKYASLSSYAFEGHQTVVLPNSDCSIELSFQVARTRPASTSIPASDSAPPPEIMFHGTKLSKSCTNEVQKLGFITTPSFWVDFSTMNAGVTNVREIRQEVLRLAQGQIINCVILEVQYDLFDQRVRNIVGSVQYWIEPQSRLVRRVEFTEATPHGPRQWSATIERIEIGGQPPPWIGQDAVSHAQPTALGKVAPNFQLHTAEGETVRLVDLRGKVVLLDFWATWCTPCLEEIPVLEKLQAETKMSSEVVVLGISDEDAAAVRGWLKQYDRHFDTLVGAKQTFADFDIGPIPARLIINRQGIVTQYFLGFGSEGRIRQSLNDAVTSR